MKRHAIFSITDEQAQILYDAAFNSHEIETQLVVQGICVRIATDAQALYIWQDGKVMAEAYPPDDLPAKPRSFYATRVVGLLAEMAIAF